MERAAVFGHNEYCSRVGRRRRLGRLGSRLVWWCGSREFLSVEVACRLGPFRLPDQYMKHFQTATASVDQACVTARHRMGCMLRQRNHSLAAVGMGLAEWPSMFLGEDSPLAVVGGEMDRVAVQE